MTRAQKLLSAAAILSLGLILSSGHFKRRALEREACQAYISQALTELTFSLARKGKDAEAAYPLSQKYFAELALRAPKGWITRRLEVLKPFHDRLHGKEAAKALPAFVPELQAFRDEMKKKRMLTLSQLLEFNALISSLSELI